MDTTPHSLAPSRSLAHDHALEQLMLRHLALEPDDPGPRLALLRIYFDERRPREFLQHAEILSPQVRQEPGSPIWREVAEMGRILMPDQPLFQHPDDIVLAFDPPQPQAPLPRRLGDEEGATHWFADLARQYRSQCGAGFLAALDLGLARGGGRPGALYHARRLSHQVGGAQLCFKREDLLPPDMHLRLAVEGQALLAQRLGRSTVVTSGHAGPALAAAAARHGLKAVVYLSREQLERGDAAIAGMRLMGAQLHTAVSPGPEGPAISALRHVLADPARCLFAPGLMAAPEPYPTLVRDCVSAIGRECRRQCLAQWHREPDLLVARVGANPDALGLFPPFVQAPGVRLVGVEVRHGLEAGPDGSDLYARFHLPYTADEEQRRAWLLEAADYPAVRREQAWLQATGRIEHARVDAAAARRLIDDCARLEGIVPPIETAQAMAWACEQARNMDKEQIVVVLMAEPVGKDLWEIARTLRMNA